MIVSLTVIYMEVLPVEQVTYIFTNLKNERVFIIWIKIICKLT